MRLRALALLGPRTLGPLRRKLTAELTARAIEPTTDVNLLIDRSALVAPSFSQSVSAASLSVSQWTCGRGVAALQSYPLAICCFLARKVLCEKGLLVCKIRYLAPEILLVERAFRRRTSGRIFAELFHEQCDVSWRKANVSCSA